MDLLRLLTCGSVDDGKSTLIGRLLHDSRLICEDVLAGLERLDLDVDGHVSTTAGGRMSAALPSEDT